MQDHFDRGYISLLSWSFQYFFPKNRLKLQGQNVKKVALKNITYRRIARRLNVKRGLNKHKFVLFYSFLSPSLPHSLYLLFICQWSPLSFTIHLALIYLSVHTYQSSTFLSLPIFIFLQMFTLVSTLFVSSFLNASLQSSSFYLSPLKTDLL